jgi:hypothetical protein
MSDVTVILAAIEHGDQQFVGMTIQQAAEVLGISPRTADFRWKFAKAWLREEMKS